MDFEKVVLEGEYVRLEPLSDDHVGGLQEAIYDGELWKLFVTLIPHPDDLNAFFTQANNEYLQGEGLTFVTIDKKSGNVAGSSCFMRASLANKRVEIGFTFLGESYQKTKINTEAKLLTLSHAFETLKLNRVELLTDYLNMNSRNAILRLGAKQEGILRSHILMPDGRVRDSVIFSILKNEWNGIKQHLKHKLARDYS